MVGLRPILVLGEAYSKCNDAAVRGEIAAAVRRAFIGSGIRGDNDDAFVKSAMQWYKQNKERLEVNTAYYLNLSDLDSRYSENPLFVMKNRNKEKRKVTATKSGESRENR